MLTKSCKVIKNPKFGSQKISSFVIKNLQLLLDLTYFNKVKFIRNFSMFNSLVFTWKRDFEVTFGIFSVSVIQINVVESYLDIYLF